MQTIFVITLNKVVGTGETVPSNFALVSSKTNAF
jgi:hypothetical protein